MVNVYQLKIDRKSAVEYRTSNVGRTGGVSGTIHGRKK